MTPKREPVHGKLPSTDYENLYALLIRELADYAVFMLDPEGRITSWNEGVRRILGFEREEFIGQPGEILFTPEDRQAGAPRAELLRAAAQGRAPDERWHLRKDGARFFCQGVVTAVRDETGTLAAFAKVMRDATAWKRAAEEGEQLRRTLEQERAWLRAILEQLPVGVMILNRLTGRLELFNAAATALLRHEPGDSTRFRPESRFGALHADGSLYSSEEYPLFRAAASGEPVAAEVPYRRGDGSLTVLSITAAPVRDRHGQVVAAVSVFEDISERRQVRDDLERANRELIELAEALQLTNAVIWRLDGTIRLWTGGAEEFYGWTPEEAAGRSIHELLQTRVTGGLEAAMQELLRSGRWQGELRHIHKDGRELFVASYWVLHRNLAGEPSEVVEVNNDITDRRRAESYLRRSNEELARFAHVAAHDLRAPVRTVRSYAELLARRYAGRLDETAREFIGYMVEGARRQEELIAGLLRYATATNAEAGAESRVDLRASLDAALANLAEDLRAAGAEVAVDPLPAVPGYPHQLLQVFQNLIGNALKYRRPEVPPRIRVSSAERRDHWLIRVDDNGMGIPSDQHEAIFQPLKRLHGAEIAGTGIGLPTCRRIVEHHGGRIWVESQPGRGSTFLFTLPKTSP